MSKPRQENHEFAVIGLGRFGRSVALNLLERGHSVLGIDRSEAIVQSLADRISRVVALDSTNEEALKQVGITEFGTVVVAIGTQFEANLMTTVALKNLGIENVICKALNERQQYILLRVGADHVVLPEYDSGARLAWQIAEPHVLEHLNLGYGFSVAEIEVPKNLLGRSLMQTNIRKKYGINVVAIKRNGTLLVPPPPDTILTFGDELLIIGADKNISSFCHEH
jgi:trk system potassium uptake protein TrkA